MELDFLSESVLDEFELGSCKLGHDIVDREFISDLLVIGRLGHGLHEGVICPSCSLRIPFCLVEHVCEESSTDFVFEILGLARFMFLGILKM